mmetsp:Transcript_160546/g.515352  ORF Transcript_160546/g.515352 Transcript_160546/m.515352 type:complete len:177 (+) Transcript_160546:68-598(+)
MASAIATWTSVVALFSMALASQSLEAQTGTCASVMNTLQSELACTSLSQACSPKCQDLLCKAIEQCTPGSMFNSLSAESVTIHMSKVKPLLNNCACPSSRSAHEAEGRARDLVTVMVPATDNSTPPSVEPEAAETEPPAVSEKKVDEVELDGATKSSVARLLCLGVLIPALFVLLG